MNVVDERQCPRCGTRTDVGCKHQPAKGAPPVASVEKPDGRRQNGNFNSPWGNKGNPSGKAAERIKADLKAVMRGTK